MGKDRILGCEVQGWDSIVDNDIPNLKIYMGHYLISLLGKKNFHKINFMNLQWKLHNLSRENKSQYLGPKYNLRKENYIAS